jgi:hypothetical protein
MTNLVQPPIRPAKEAVEEGNQQSASSTAKPNNNKTTTQHEYEAAPIDKTTTTNEVIDQNEYEDTQEHPSENNREDTTRRKSYFHECDAPEIMTLAASCGDDQEGKDEFLAMVNNNYDLFHNTIKDCVAFTADLDRLHIQFKDVCETVLQKDQQIKKEKTINNQTLNRYYEQYNLAEQLQDKANIQQQATDDLLLQVEEKEAVITTLQDEKTTLQNQIQRLLGKNDTLQELVGNRPFIPQTKPRQTYSDSVDHPDSNDEPIPAIRVSATTAEPEPEGKTKVKEIATPDPFSGVDKEGKDLPASAYDQWKFQVKRKLEIDCQLFPTEARKVAWVEGLLKDKAYLRIRRAIEKREHRVVDDVFASLDLHFEDVNHRAKSQVKFTELRQEALSFREFYLNFKEYADDCDYSNETLAIELRGKLNKKFFHLVATDKPDYLAMVTKLSYADKNFEAQYANRRLATPTINNSTREQTEAAGRGRGRGRGRGGATGATSTVPFVQRTEQMKAFIRDNNLCYKCVEAGHLFTNCPNNWREFPSNLLPQQPNYTPQIRIQQRPNNSYPSRQQTTSRPAGASTPTNTNTLHNTSTVNNIETGIDQSYGYDDDYETQLSENSQARG